MSRVAWLAALALFGTAQAGEFSVGEISIQDPWARETAGSAKAGGSFMTIANSGTEADRLVSAGSDIARKVELHTHIKDGEVMRMRPVEGGIEIPAGGSASLAPGGFHVMMMGLQEQLVEGASFRLVLNFERNGEVEVEVDIRDIAYQGHKSH